MSSKTDPVAVVLLLIIIIIIVVGKVYRRKLLKVAHFAKEKVARMLGRVLIGEMTQSLFIFVNLW